MKNLNCPMHLGYIPLLWRKIYKEIVRSMEDINDFQKYYYG